MALSSEVGVVEIGVAEAGADTGRAIVITTAIVTTTEIVTTTMTAAVPIRVNS
jgi:hypothetical protein